MLTFDRRLTPWRPDLAAVHLQGQLDAERFAEGTRYDVTMPGTGLYGSLTPSARLETQVTFGTGFVVYELRDGWAWGQAEEDGYVGYVRADRLAPPANPPTHKVIALRSFRFSAADLKSAPLDALSLNAQLSLGASSGRFIELQHGGYVFADHVAPIETAAPDWVAVAERFVGVPYLWGGKDSLGLDCSGLIQTALAAAGHKAPRDSDQQFAGLGAPLLRSIPPTGLQRGDLVFWKGHVGVMRDAETLLHANAHHMAVASEPLAEAMARIAANNGGPVTGVNRLA